MSTIISNNHLKKQGRKPGETLIGRFFTHLFLGITSFIMLIPFIWMLLSSFKTDAEILAVPIKWLPKMWRFSNYAATFNIAPWGRYFLNTITVTGAVIIGQLVIASMAAYAFARLNFKGKNVIFLLYLSTMMLPHQVTMVPTYQLISKFGMIDTLWSLILPGLFSSFGVFMLRQFFLSIPTALEDAAKIDGCSYPRIYWEIVIKNSKPVLITLVLFIFMRNWNNFLQPMLYLNKRSLWTLSLGLSKFRGENSSTWSYMMCGAVVCILPVLGVFLLCQKYFIEGIVSSGVKG